MRDRLTPVYDADPDYPARRVALCPGCGSTWTINTAPADNEQGWTPKPGERECRRCGACAEA